MKKITPGSWGMLLSLATVVLAQDAHAFGFYFEEMLTPNYTHNVTGNFALPANAPANGLGVDTRTTLGFKLGYFLIGGTLNYSTLSIQANAVSGGANSVDSKQTTFAVGPTLGVAAGGFRFSLTAFPLGFSNTALQSRTFAGTLVINQENKDKLHYGFQGSVGYFFSLGAGFMLGPSLTYAVGVYKSRTFTNALAPATNFTDRKFSTRRIDGALTPMITLTWGMGGGGHAAAAKR